ncbi:hypothetical protein RHSIM_Rhsim09G0055200 [Rhododendron simsii]|uniref:ZZ-type domain-containing protein n=1 Tax=Rhododendron simsii TaxID=118357 RepID=A0A834LEI1_RHOSS|nr:hypothetical protein RHSIM_Rhsim09G0055200 [Rhododendron simsii]
MIGKRKGCPLQACCIRQIFRLLLMQMYPIIGKRYRCKDCKEKIGFDLCEGCFNSSSKLPGRFNQQHTPDHKLENVQPHLEANDVSRLETDDYESDSPDDIGFSPFARVPEEDSASHMSSR